ncbi:MAG TPA: hypothetical protein VM260_19885, partial [Pirellula sp.]|nr:hypothetical protein [Pirellula sp.]
MNDTDRLSVAYFFCRMPRGATRARSRNAKSESKPTIAAAATATADAATAPVWTKPPTTTLSAVAAAAATSNPASMGVNPQVLQKLLQDTFYLERPPMKFRKQTHSCDAGPPPGMWKVNS